MSIPELRLSDNGFYYVCWTENRRSKRVSTRTRNLDAAKAFLGSWLLMERRAPVEAAQTYTVAELWKLYAEKHGAKVAAPKTLKYSWQNLEQHFGAKTLAEIDQSLVEDYVDLREAGDIGHPSKSSTIRRELIALRACMNWAAHKRQKLINKADVPDFDLPPDGEARDRWLTTDEIERLVTAARALRVGQKISRGELFVWLALETAARKQAILDLTWDRVDFETGMIHFNVPGRAITKKRRTSTPISARLLPVLKTAYAERETDLVLGHKGAIWPVIQRVANKAGFKAADGRKSTGVYPHLFRHTAATHMARRGVPLFDIAGILGNSLKMVEAVYAKHCPGRLKAAVDQISGGVFD